MPVKKELTRGEKVIAFIETYCKVPAGDMLPVGSPIKLLPFQKEWLTAVFDNPHGTHTGVLCIGRKNGKGLALDTPIPTPTGWRTMGELREGDTLFDETGAPCKVQFLSPIHTGLRCWRLTFSDGTSVVADEQHRWMTTTDRRRGPRISTTPEIAAKVREVRADGGVEYRHSVRKADCLRTPAVDLPIDPYLLGAWLGDGHSRSARLTCGDEDLAHFCEQIQTILGFAPVCRKERTAWAIGITGGRGGKKASKFQALLRAENLLRDKHIPDRYLWAGTEQRRALLQGLMDTDGTITPTGNSGAVSCEYTGCNEKLVRQVLTLARSLGLKSTLRSRPAKLHGVEVNTSHHVQFTAWADDAVFRLPRKAARLKPRPAKPTRASSLQIVACEEVESVPTRCLQVSSPSSLFLCGEGMTPTHNTALIAGVLLAFIAGPEAKQNSEIVSGAMDLAQAALVFNLACRMIEMSPELSERIRVFPSGKRLLGISKNVEYKALSSEAKTKHGLSPRVIIFDEMGQVRGPTDPFVSTLQTAQGAYDNAMQLIISTQAPTDVDMLSQIIDAQKRDPDPHIVCHVYAAPEDADMGDEEAWKAANPALGVFRSLKDMRKLYAQAKAQPSFEPEFRNLNLNTRTEAAAPFVTKSIWQANAGAPIKKPNQKVWGGLDLSSVSDLTAAVLVSDEYDVFCDFWLPEHGLREKSEKDKVPYDVWEKQGFLRTTPGKAIQYEHIALRLRQIFDDFDVQKFGFDRYLMEFLRPWLIRAGFSDAELDKFEPFGQGTASMTPALRDLEVLLLDEKLKHGGHPVLDRNAANAKVVGDSGARKFDKKTARGRIDGMVALAIAVGVMPQPVDEDEGDDGFYSNPIMVGV